MDNMNSRIKYLYRDASNFKFWNAFKVGGTVQISDIKPYLFDREYFVPELIGVQRLNPATTSADDHDLHEIVSIEPTTERSVICLSSEFPIRLQKVSASGWFRKYGSAFLG